MNPSGSESKIHVVLEEILEDPLEDSEVKVE